MRHLWPLFGRFGTIDFLGTTQDSSNNRLYTLRAFYLRDNGLMVIPLSRLLGRSPIAPIQEHMQLAEEAVQALCQLLEAAADAQWPRCEEIYASMQATASAAQSLRRDIRRHLPRGLLLAMPRPDLITLLDIQDRVADGALQAAHLIALRKAAFPAKLNASLSRFCTLLAAAAGQTLASIRELDEMLTQGFGKHERQRMEKMLGTLYRQVARCETHFQRLFQQICKAEASLPALDAMFCFQLAANLQSLAKACGDVGEQLELLGSS